MRARLPLIAVTIALVTHNLVSLRRNGIGLGPYRIDLDVYRIGSLTWLHGGNLYGALPRTSAGIGLPFSYPPVAAVVLSPLAVVPMAVAGFVLTLASIALTWVVLRVFTRSLSSRLSLWWLLPAALALEPVRATLNFGQVNIALMALVAVDCLHPEPRWPRGALVGLAAAVKLTPLAFILFFLIRNDRRAASTAAASFAAVTGGGLILDWHDSVRYWASVVFSTSRPGSPAFVSNQAISGVLARSGLDPRSQGGSAAWLALSAAVLVVAVIGMRRALAAGEPAWALSVNALAALLISPISWSHHWVWAAPALMCLAVTGRRHSWRGGVAAAWAGLVLFEVSPMWLLPHSVTAAGVGSAWWEQVTGDTYVIFGVAVLALAARFTPRSGEQPGACALSRNVSACPHNGVMPGIPHEAVVEVLRNEPQLLAMLLGRLGVRLPSGSVPVIADSNLSSRDPDFMKTLLADNVFVFQGLRKKVAVVAEVQTARPKRSRSLAWPAYLANARAILRCDTVLCVFGLSADAVLGSLRTIMTGHPGFALSPLVTGHRMLPGPGGMAFGPELTVLNVLTGDLDLTTHEGRMLALVSIAPAPIERRERYTRYIRAVIPPAARDALEELLKTVIKDEFLDGILAQGEAKGEARMLLRYLGIRFEVSAVVRERITSCGDPAQLEAWLDRAVSAATLDEVFAG